MRCYIANFYKFTLLELRAIFLLCLFLFIVINVTIVEANPQDYRYQKAFKVQRISLSQGLSQSVVNDVIQDSDGYIWLATEDGLNRFDSYEFKIFRHDHKNNQSLHENWVISLVEEPGFGIWVGTVAGLSFFNPIDESFTDYSEFNIDLNASIKNFLITKEGVVWIATDNGLFYVDRKINSVKPFVSDANITLDDEIISLAEADGYIYVATSSCIYRIEKSNYKLVNLCHIETLTELNNAILSVIKIKNEFLWIGTTQGLYRFNIETNFLTEYLHDETDDRSISGNIINDLATDSSSSLWIATRNGLNRYDESKDSFEHYSQQNFSADSLSSNDVISLYVDHQNLIWLGTYGGGANILDPNQHQFEHILSRSDVVGMGNNNTIHAIEKDQSENLWLASYGGGLIRYNMLTGEMSRPLHDKNYDNYVYSLLVDYSNRLWVGALSELKIIDLKDHSEIKTRFIIDGQLKREIDGVTRIHEDHQGVIWIGTENGLLKIINIQFVDQVLQIELRDLTYKLPNSFTNFSTTISTIIHDQNGDYWIGGYAGLIYYKVQDDQWLHYRYEKNNPQSLSNNNVQVIYEDSQGFLWIGTADGLNRVNRSRLNSDVFYFERITTYEGLPNNAIYGILEDNQQQLWISTTLGLVKYSHNTVNMDVFRSVDGLSSDEFNTGAYFSDSHGQLYFGSVDGITIVKNIVNPNKNNDHNILFSSIKIGSRNIDTYQINHSQMPSITQQVDESSIDVSVVNINFNKLGTQRYRYRVLGVSEDWNYLGTRNNIFIASLPEGRYQLEVESQQPGQEWLGQSKVLKIIVKADFLSSSQAYYMIILSSVLIFLFSLFFVARFYKRRIKKIDNRMNVGILRLKELRADNKALDFDLQAKKNEVVSLNRKIELNERKLGVEKYRDATTGFYRLSYLYQVKDELDGVQETEVLLGFGYYKGLVVFEIDDYLKVHNKHGPLAAAEFTAKISMVLRQKTDSETQIFCVQNGLFLILTHQDNTEIFLDNMINLRYQIIRSEFEVANGISANSKVSLSIMDISQSKVTNKAELMAMIDLIIQLHRFSVTKNEQSSVKMQVNKDAGYFVKNAAKIDLLLLQKNGDLVLSRL